MRRCIIHFVFLASLAGPIAAWALTLGSTVGIHSPASLSGHLAARCVADDSESIEDVANPERAREFVALPAQLQQGYTNNTCWLRFELQRTQAAPQDWLLEVGVPYLDDVTLFVAPNNREKAGGFQSLRLGDRFPYTERPIPHRLFVFPLLLPDTEPTTAYLRIRTSSTMLVETINVWQYPGLLAASQHENALYWLVFGIIVLGILSNLVFWILLREGIYRSYTLYLLTLLALNLTSSGIATQWLWSQLPVVADRAVGFMAALMFLVGLFFFDEVLGLRQNFPRLRRVIPVIHALYASGGVLAATGHYSSIAPVLQTITLTVTFGITAAGPWLLWLGRRHLWLYVLAFSTQLLIAIAALLRNLGLWPLEITIDQFIMGATALHVVLLNFALADRIRYAQREKVSMEKTAARLEAELIAIGKQRDFMSMVAHEFRTPLTIIDTSTQRIAAQQQTDAKKNLERCANIRAAVQRLTRLMDEFLTIDRLEGQIRRFAPVPCRINEITDAVLAGFPSQRIDFRRSGSPETLVGDPALLRVALANLITNALRFSPPGRSVRFLVEKGAGGDVVFSVADDGPGVPSDERPQLFEKYFRGRNSQSHPGTGLGLFLVEQIAKLHGGTVHLSSALGQETRFSLIIPSPNNPSPASD